MRILAYVSPALLLAAASQLAACSSDPIALQQPDAAIADSGRSTLDAAQVALDSGIVTDSGANVDAGVATDAAAEAGTVAAIPTDSPAAIDAWIATGEYKTWKCEAAPHPPVGNGAHGINRICSNPALSAHGAGSYPVGAANVKELYGGNTISGYALMLKKTSGASANTWFYYEKIGASVVANGLAAGGCSGCHSSAPKDYVYTQVR